MSTPLRELRDMNVKRQRETNPPPADEGNITSNTVSRITDLPTDPLTDTSGDLPTGTPSGTLTHRPTDIQTDTPVSQSVSPQVRRSAARAKVKDLADSPMRAVTLKCPEDLNNYLDHHIHENWKAKIKKQDLLTRALQLLVYELETGEELIDLEKGR